MKTRKRCSIILALAIIVSCMPVIAAAQTTLQIGDYLQMGTYYGEPILWRCIDIDENGPLMLSDRIITLKAFDAISAENKRNGSHARHEKRYWCSNYWGDSNIRSWLNSDAEAGKVEWLCGYPPMITYENGKMSFVTCNPYDDEAGFLSNFSDTEKSVIKEVTQKLLLSAPEVDAGMAVTGTDYEFSQGIIRDLLRNYDTAYAEYTMDKMFLLDEKQVYRIYENREILGEKYHIGKPTAQCVENSEYKDDDLSTEKGFYNWMRSPSCKSVDVARAVDELGNGDGSLAERGDNGVRPAFYMDSDKVELDGRGTSENPYVVVYSHTHALAKHEKTDAVCVEVGFEEYWKCKVCNKLFYDEAALSEIADIADVTIPAKGHIIKTDTAIAPTCEADGKTEGQRCVICNEIILAQTAIPKLNHNWGTWNIIKEPTLTETGKAERVCKNDISHKETVFLPALTDTRIWTEGPMSEPSEEFDGAKSYFSDYGTVTLVIPKRTENQVIISGIDSGVKYEDGRAVVSVTQKGKYAVIFAAYDGEGKLSGVEAREMQLNEGENTVASSGGFKADGNFKVMLWNSLQSMKPVTADKNNIFLK